MNEGEVNAGKLMGIAGCLLALGQGSHVLTGAPHSSGFQGLPRAGFRAAQLA